MKGHCLQAPSKKWSSSEELELPAEVGPTQLFGTRSNSSLKDRQESSDVTASADSDEM